MPSSASSQALTSILRVLERVAPSDLEWVLSAIKVSISAIVKLPVSQPILPGLNGGPHAGGPVGPKSPRKAHEKPTKSPSKIPPVLSCTSFDLFWIEYPNHKNKKRALEVWENLEINQELLDLILQAVREQRTWKEWAKDGGLYVPHASTWLRGHRWADEAHVAHGLAQSQAQRLWDEAQAEKAQKAQAEKRDREGASI